MSGGFRFSFLADGDCVGGATGSQARTHQPRGAVGGGGPAGGSVTSVESEPIGQPRLCQGSGYKLGLYGITQVWNEIWLCRLHTVLDTLACLFILSCCMN